MNTYKIIHVNLCKKLHNRSQKELPVHAVTYSDMLVESLYDSISSFQLGDIFEKLIFAIKS